MRKTGIALYNATDGANWTNNTNWNTSAPIRDWYGVSVIGNRVTAIELGSFSGNNLNGTLPTEIGDLTELTNLNLQFNSLLTGNIPTSIGNLTKLETLVFWNDDFTGNIPTELGNCTSLKTLTLEDNRLTGSIPASLSGLTAMAYFWINGNQLSGAIPDIFSGWTNLVFFSIGNGNGTAGAHNDFTGDLDLSNNAALRLCWVDNTLISTLNVKNGNNTNMSDDYFKAVSVPNLTCVFVDDINYSTTTWMSIDASATFVETQATCDALAVSDITLEESIVLYPNPNAGVLHIRNNGNVAINQITILNTLGQKVMDSQEVNDIDMTNLPNGMYYVNILSTKGDKMSYKIIKE